MDDLIAFLRARLDERERRANSWPDGVDYDENQWVLADVAAKRQLLQLHEHKPIPEHRRHEFDLSIYDPPFGCTRCHWDGDREETFGGGWCEHVRLLALPHADHPEYQESWKP
jgi:hypothetical protein